MADAWIRVSNNSSYSSNCSNVQKLSCNLDCACSDTYNLACGELNMRLTKTTLRQIDHPRSTRSLGAQCSSESLTASSLPSWDRD